MANYGFERFEGRQSTSFLPKTEIIFLHLGERGGFSAFHCAKKQKIGKPFSKKFNFPPTKHYLKEFNYRQVSVRFVACWNGMMGKKENMNVMWSLLHVEMGWWGKRWLWMSWLQMGLDIKDSGGVNWCEPILVSPFWIWLLLMNEAVHSSLEGGFFKKHLSTIFFKKMNKTPGVVPMEAIPR